MDVIQAQYAQHHSKLLKDYTVYASAKVLEVYAYYQGDDSESDDVDKGTVLRFVEPTSNSENGGRPCCLLPGLESVEAEFNEDSQAAYCDHWVSNGSSLFGLMFHCKSAKSFVHSFKSLAC